MIESEQSSVEALGVEAHPFVARVGQTKLLWRQDARAFHQFALAMLEQAKTIESAPCGYPPLIEKCFPPDILRRLDALRRAWEASADGSPPSELSWLALTAILRECSPVGTAQWQYVLPNKSKAKSVDPYAAFTAKVYLYAGDMAARQRRPLGPVAALNRDDARRMESVPDAWADLVITSPPYANNYDYADATRLEMSFFRQIRGWGDLHNAVRQHLVRSCSQHRVAGASRALLDDPLLAPIHGSLTEVYERLEAERSEHGGKKAYHTMIAAYFADMARVW
ncbi:MAG: DNA modification methylase, partial [Ktedonobacterales bacterium]